MRMTMEQAIAAGILFPANDMSESARDGKATTFALPVETVSEANRRDHWAVRHRRAKRQKRTARIATMQHAAHLRYHIQADEDIRLAITLVRLMRSGQRRFDSDNLQSGFKAIRDGIASALGIDDGSDRLEWHYAQEKGGRIRGGVRVVITRIDF